MIVYRIANKVFSQDISGTGASLYGARWNSPNTPMLYAGEHLSLAVLEMLVHTGFRSAKVHLDLLHIYLPTSESKQEISLKKLKKDWHTDLAYTQFIGDAFIKSGQHLWMKVPSVIIPDEFNFLINPNHDQFKKVHIQKTIAFHADQRLFKP